MHVALWNSTCLRPRARFLAQNTDWRICVICENYCMKIVPRSIERCANTDRAEVKIAGMRYYKQNAGHDQGVRRQIDVQMCCCPVNLVRAPVNGIQVAVLRTPAHSTERGWSGKSSRTRFSDAIANVLIALAEHCLSSMASLGTTAIRWMIPLRSSLSPVSRRLRAICLCRNRCHDRSAGICGG
jgi:hypothetical protein